MIYTRFSKLFTILFTLMSLAACGGGIGTAPPAPILGSVTTSALSLAGPFPADIDIVDQPGLRDTAFVTTTSPAAVLAVDLNANPLKLSGTFQGLPSLPAQASAGIPSVLFVVDGTHAFLLTSTSLIYFNPTDAAVYQIVDLTTSIELTAPLTQVDAGGNPTGQVSGTFTPAFPSNLAVLGNKVAVSFSDLSFTGFSLSGATQGIVRLFDIQGNTVVPAAPTYVAATGFNTTGLTALPNGTAFLITNSGLTRFTPDFSNQEPVTSASVNVINPSMGQNIANLNLGMTTPAFRPWAVSPDGKHAFLGSGSGGYVIEIDLDSLQVVRGEGNPIVVTSAQNGTDFLDDVVMGHDGNALFVMSFNHSSVYGLDLTQGEPRLLDQVIDLSFPGSAGITGAGPAALRPGSPGVDFTGPDLFVLTGDPGTVAAIKTY
jgi:hypothetical protein